MTLATRVRFTQPVDPRKVWDIGRQIINAPENFQVDKRGDSWHATPGQGANALMWMNYGHEGARIIDDTDDYETMPPSAYVELTFDTPYGYKDNLGRNCGDLHASLIDSLVDHFPSDAMTWQNEYDGTWHGLESLSTLGRVVRVA